MSAELRVRHGTVADLDAVVAIEQACAEAPHWGRAHYDSLVEPAGKTLQRRTLLVAESQGRITGFAVATVFADEAELESVAVSPDARRQGTGRELSRAAMDWASGHGAAQMRLEVRAGNRAARAMYETLGFAQVGVRKDYYRDPVDDAVVLASNLQAGRNL